MVKFYKLVALVLRGDKELNDIKAEKHPLIAAPLTFASDEEVEQALMVTMAGIAAGMRNTG